MKPNDFTKEKFILKIPLYIEINKAFELIATSKGLTSWFLGNADFFNDDEKGILDSSFIKQGTAFKWVWQKEYGVTGQVLKHRENELFEFTFGTDFSVSISLIYDFRKKYTEVTLTQKNHNPSDSNEFGFINCCVCWSFFLSNLKSVAEFNIDLREQNIINESFVNQ
jgi:hypothetical protein